MAETRLPIRTLIVEDERHMRRYLRKLLVGEKEVLIVGEAASGLEGMAQIRTLSPDLVFLDIQMPEFDGFDLIAKIGTDKMPAFIFVTAYSQYAVRAFEVGAVDYLCKPFDQIRLSASVDRAMHHLEARGAPAVGAEHGAEGHGHAG